MHFQTSLNLFNCTRKAPTCIVYIRDGHEIRISELSEYPDIQIRI
jgi:hypothetical protein